MVVKVDRMPTRKPLRIPRFDYATAGAYFVTTCVAGKACLLGRVETDGVVLNLLGHVVARELAEGPARRGAALDSWVVMPNHIHAVVWLPRRGASLGAVVGAFKSSSARDINRVRGTEDATFWQRGYFDHVVRDEDDLRRVREYIATNPQRWWARER